MSFNLKNQIDQQVISCSKCNLCKFHVNDNSQSDKGYGKLVGRAGTTNEIMIVGLNPSHVRFPNLKHPFCADYDKCEKNNYGAPFIRVLMNFGIYDKCYITNIVKCSSPNNKISDADMVSCVAHFFNEHQFCNPKLIIACGNQVYGFLSRRFKHVERIYHPNYCFSYHRMSIKEYILHINEVLKRNGYGLCMISQ